MKPGKVEKYMLERIDQDGAILLALIDPDKQPFERGAKIAQIAYEEGADIILVGGSIGAQGLLLDKTTKMIRECVDIPIVLFPGNIGTITPYADAIEFMYLLNSRDIYWLSTAQIQGAPVVKRVGLEVIPTAYIVIEPGRAVGWISNVNLIPRDRPDLAAATALAGEYMGAHLIVMDSGSGAPEPAPETFITKVKENITIPLIYGGGCRTPEQVKKLVKAGVDGIQVGTAFELDVDEEKARERIRAIVKAIKDSGNQKERLRKKYIPLIRIPRFFDFHLRFRKRNLKKKINS
jgi:phosphoglycerol geranylgeranyltransferase